MRWVHFTSASRKQHFSATPVSRYEIRPSVVFRKVTNGFRSEWGADVHAGYRSLTSTARLHEQTTIDAVHALVSGQHLNGMDAILPAR